MLDEIPPFSVTFVARVAASNRSPAKDRATKGLQLINVHRRARLIRTISILIRTPVVPSTKLNRILVKKGFLPLLLLWQFSPLFGLNIN